MFATVLSFYLKVGVVVIYSIWLGGRVDVRNLIWVLSQKPLGRNVILGGDIGYKV